MRNIELRSYCWNKAHKISDAPSEFLTLGLIWLKRSWKRHENVREIDLYAGPPIEMSFRWPFLAFFWLKKIDYSTVPWKVRWTDRLTCRPSHRVARTQFKWWHRQHHRFLKRNPCWPKSERMDRPSCLVASSRSITGSLLRSSTAEW